MSNRFTRGLGLFGSLRASGSLAVNGKLFSAYSASALTDAIETLTVTQIITNGIVSGTPTASRAKTIPTGTLTCQALSNEAVGDSFEVHVINLAAATHPLVITAATGATIVGNATVDANTSATFKVRVSATNTVVWYRV